MHTAVQTEVPAAGDPFWPPKYLGEHVSPQTEHSQASFPIFTPQGPILPLPPGQRPGSLTYTQEDKKGIPGRAIHIEDYLEVAHYTFHFSHLIGPNLVKLSEEKPGK